MYISKTNGLKNVTERSCKNMQWRKKIDEVGSEQKESLRTVLRYSTQYINILEKTKSKT